MAVWIPPLPIFIALLPLVQEPLSLDFNQVLISRSIWFINIDLKKSSH